VVAVAHPGGRQAEEPGGVGRVAPAALHPAQHCRRAPASLGPIAVGGVRLLVVVLEEAIMDRLQFTPGGGSRVVAVRHAAHDVEVGLDVILPGLPLVDLAFLDPQRRVDRLGVVGPKDAALDLYVIEPAAISGIPLLTRWVRRRQTVSRSGRAMSFARAGWTGTGRSIGRHPLGTARVLGSSQRGQPKQPAHNFPGRLKKAVRRWDVAWKGESRDRCVDQGRLSRCDRSLKCRLKLFNGLDSAAFCSPRFRVGGVVGILEVDERGLMVGLELLQSDEVEFTVIEYDPDGWYFILNRGHELETGHEVASVAASDNNRPLRVGALHAQSAIDTYGHRTECPGLPEVLTPSEFQILVEPGGMGTGIAEDDGVVGQHSGERPHQLAGMKLPTEIKDALGVVVLRLVVAHRDWPHQ